MVPLFPPIFVRSWEDDFSLLLLLPLLLLPLPISTITRVTKNTRYTRITKERENVVIPISFFFILIFLLYLYSAGDQHFLGEIESSISLRRRDLDVTAKVSFPLSKSRSGQPWNVVIPGGSRSLDGVGRRERVSFQDVLGMTILYMCTLSLDNWKRGRIRKKSAPSRAIG